MSDPFKATPEDIARELQKHRGDGPQPRTCDACRHWMPIDRFEYEGKCELIYRDTGHAHDGVRGESGSIITGQKFGCVHWEAIEAT